MAIDHSVFDDSGSDEQSTLKQFREATVAKDKKANPAATAHNTQAIVRRIDQFSDFSVSDIDFESTGGSFLPTGCPQVLQNRASALRSAPQAKHFILDLPNRLLSLLAFYISHQGVKGTPHFCEVSIGNKVLRVREFMAEYFWLRASPYHPQESS